MTILVRRKPTSSKFIDLTNRQFGDLTVLGFAGFQGTQPKWRCRCACGKVRLVFGNQLAVHHYKCRCLTRNHPYHRLIWNKKVKQNSCEAWRSISQFIRDVGKRPRGQHLVRKRLALPWQPDNVQWQKQNQRDSIELFEHKGKKQSRGEWCRELGISRQRFEQRTVQGLTGDQLFAPRKMSEEKVKILQEYRFKTRGRPQIEHNWEKLSDGKIYQLEPGVDFHCKASIFRCAAAQWARRHHKRVRTSKWGETVVLQFYESNGEA